MCAVCFAMVTTGIGSGQVVLKKVDPYGKISVFFNPQRVYLAILIVLGLFAFLPILAPILKKLGITPLADLIYNMYFIFCHQRASHSFHIFDYQFAYCARDTFIWGTVFLITLLRYKYYFKPFKWYWFILLCIPMAVDGGSQFISLLLNTLGNAPFNYESTNLSRAITGTLFGIAVGGSLIAYMVDTTITGFKDSQKQFKGLNIFFMTTALSTISFLLLYLIQIQTSFNYPPIAFLDSKPRNYGYTFIQEPRLIHK